MIVAQKPFLMYDLLELELQDSQKSIKKYLTLDVCRDLEGEYSRSLLVNDEIMMCGGVMPLWGTRAIAWSFIGKNAVSHMRILTKETNKYLDEFNKEFKRIEMSVGIEYKLGHKWAKMLNFELETEFAPKYDAFGNDSSVYVRIR